MTSTLLEQSRLLHEDIEILEKTMYTELGDASGAKLKRPEEVARDQVVATLLNAHREKCEQLASVYEDADGARRDEINGMSGQGVFTAFYDQLKTIREYHRRFPKEPSTESYEQEMLGALLNREDASQGFSGEESEGKYVDMHAAHEMYLNLKGADHLDYASYLKRCSDLQAIDKGVAGTSHYQRYVAALHSYFVDYLKRTQPLMPLAELLAKAESDFEGRWQQGAVERWQGASNAAAAAAAAVSADFDIHRVSGVEELEALGLETLKGLLVRHGLKCGGSLKDRAERLLLLKGRSLEEVPKQHRAKGGKPAGAAAGANSEASNGTAAVAAAVSSANRAVALLEEQTSRLGELLADVLEETANMVEKKQARTYEELERDLAAQEEDDMEARAAAAAAPAPARAPFPPLFRWALQPRWAAPIAVTLPRPSAEPQASAQQPARATCLGPHGTPGLGRHPRPPRLYSPPARQLRACTASRRGGRPLQDAAPPRTPSAPPTPHPSHHWDDRPIHRQVVEEDEDEDKPIYNPLNLPLGWDGKPIPYWLYKLHGLNIEYKCEICGNYSYWGPRAYERHFQEWRHAHGMRCLAIPNTKEFHGSAPFRTSNPRPRPRPAPPPASPAPHRPTRRSPARVLRSHAHRGRVHAVGEAQGGARPERLEPRARRGVRGRAGQRDESENVR